MKLLDLFLRSILLNNLIYVLKKKILLVKYEMLHEFIIIIIMQESNIQRLFNIHVCNKLLRTNKVSTLKSRNTSGNYIADSISKVTPHSPLSLKGNYPS